MAHLTVLNYARQFVAGGLSVIPIKCDGSKSPAVGSWNPYRERPPTDRELCDWFDRPQPAGLALVGGYGGLAVLDIDDQAYSDDVCRALEKSWPSCWESVAVVDTPRPGRQLLMRTTEPPACQKLAHRRKSDGIGVEAFIETKAAGGYVVTAGSPIAVHLNRVPYRHVHGCAIHELPVVDRFYVDKVLAVGRLFNQIEFERTEHSTKRSRDEAPRPGDVYDKHADWTSLLIRAGWTLDHTDGDVEFWRRPGKDVGHSATLGYLIEDNVRLLSVFSSSLGYGPSDGKPTVLTPFEFLALDVYKAGWAQATLEAVEQFGPKIDAAQAGWRQGQSDSGDDSKYIMDVDLASDVEPEDIEWLWPQFLPLGMTTVYSGEQGLGKSFMSIDLVSRLTRGGSFPDGSQMKEPGSVVMLLGEDSKKHVAVPRLLGAGAVLNRVLLVGPMIRDAATRRAVRPLSFSEDSELLADYIQSFEQRGEVPCRLLVIDPLSAFCGDSDINHPAESRVVMTHVGDLCERFGVSALVVHHFGKDQKRESLHRSMGSTSITAAARVFLGGFVDRNDPTRRIVARIKSNISSTRVAMAYRLQLPANPLSQRISIAWEPETFEFTEDMLRERSENEQVREELGEWLDSIEYPRPTKDVYGEAQELFGCSDKLVRKVAKERGITAQKGVDEGGRWVFVREATSPDDEPGGEQKQSPPKGAEERSNGQETPKSDANPYIHPASELESSLSSHVRATIGKHPKNPQVGKSDAGCIYGKASDLQDWGGSDDAPPASPTDEAVREDRQDKPENTDEDNGGGFVLGGEDSDDGEDIEWV